MPSITPKQKINQVKMFGGKSVEIILTGDTYDDAFVTAKEQCKKGKSVFIHPFDDEKIIEGQGSIGPEILNDFEGNIDYLFVPVGGGGLASGLGTYFKHYSPSTKIIGVEPGGAPSMTKSIQQGKLVELAEIDNFIDGASVKKVGVKTFEICKNILDDIITIPEGKVCSTMLSLYNKDAIIVEPAGALTISALDFYAKKIENKKVVCIVSGGNNDITRTEEIKERAQMYEGLKHYFIIRFPQRAGALREFLNNVLGPDDDITLFEYTKKNARENGPALIGIELKHKKDFTGLIRRMKQHKIIFEYLNKSPDLFRFII